VDDSGGQRTNDYSERPSGFGSTGLNYNNWINRCLSVIKKRVRTVGLFTCLCKFANMGYIGVALSGVLISCSQPHIFLSMGIRVFKTLETE